MKAKFIKLLLISMMILACSIMSVHATNPFDDSSMIEKTSTTTMLEVPETPSVEEADVDIDGVPVEVVVKEVDKTKPKSIKDNRYFNVMLKFVLSMVWVIISSIVIYVLLISYKKLIGKKSKLPVYTNRDDSLYTPKNFKEALKKFLEKTKWD